MKPRLVNLPLTEDDGDIWLDAARRWQFGAKQRMLDSYMVADRRDAALMLLARTRLGPGPMCVENADYTDFIDTSGWVLGARKWYRS